MVGGWFGFGASRPQGSTYARRGPRGRPTRPHLRINARGFNGSQISDLFAVQSPDHPSTIRGTGVVLLRSRRTAAGDGGSSRCSSGSWKIALMRRTEIFRRDQQGKQFKSDNYGMSERVCGAMVARLTSTVIRYQKVAVSNTVMLIFFFPLALLDEWRYLKSCGSTFGFEPALHHSPPSPWSFYSVIYLRVHRGCRMATTDQITAFIKGSVTCSSGSATRKPSKARYLSQPVGRSCSSGRA